MRKSRTKKAALNTMFASVSEIVLLVCGLILPRLILSHYGSAYNGITSSAKQFLSATSLLNVGIAGTTRVALYKSLAENDIKKTSGLVKATELYMQKVGVVLLIYAGILTVLYPILVDTGYSWKEVAPLILAACISAFGQYVIGTTYRAFLSADQSVYVVYIFNIISVILNTVCNIILINLGCTIQVVRIVSSTIMMLNPVFLGLYIKKKYKLDTHCEPDNSALALRKDVMAHSIANIIHDHTDVVILTIFTNVKIVSIYSVYGLTMSALKKIQTVFTSGTEAIYGDMWAKEEYGKIRSSLEVYEYIIGAIISVIFTTALIMILPFIAIYTKGVNDVNYILPTYAALVTIANAWFSMRAPYVTLVQGAGKYKETKSGAYIEAGMNLCLSLILVQFFGIVGTVIGTLAANIFRTMQYAIYIDKHIVKRGFPVILKRLAWIAFNMASVWLLFHYLGDIGLNISNDWLLWIVKSMIVGVTSVLVTAITSFLVYRQDMMAMFQIMKRLSFKKKRKKLS